MDISGLQQCLASAVRYIQEHSRAGITAAPYFDELPENFIVPSIYFPVPRTESRRATLSAWRTDIHMECWFAAATDWEAFRYADRVRDSILADGCAIDIMGRDGAPSGEKFRVTEPGVRKEESRIVRLAFAIREYFSFVPEASAAANDMHFSGLIKPDAAYEAWLAATQELRKKQEVQKECLEKALEELRAWEAGK